MRKGQVVRGAISHSGSSNSLLLSEGVTSLFENSDWLSTVQAAAYLLRFRSDGQPSRGSIYNMVYRGQIRKRKFRGRLYFSKFELDRALESKPSTEKRSA
jgi:hypothetical protein